MCVYFVITHMLVETTVKKVFLFLFLPSRSNCEKFSFTHFHISHQLQEPHIIGIIRLHRPSTCSTN